jgi:hypothetical protein
MDILTALLDLIQSLGLLLLAVVQAVLPWSALIGWIAWWTLAVDWVRLRSYLLQGGWIGVMLIALTAILVWGVVAPPDGGSHSLLGLHVSNFVGKTIYVTALLVIMLLCGSVQLSGCCSKLVNLEQPSSGGDGHGQDSHGHDDHHDGHAHAAHHGGH